MFYFMKTKTINFLISIKNASKVKQEFFEVNYNSKFINILSFLYKKGFIQSYYCNVETEKLKVFLRYPFEKNILENLKIMSFPSKKMFLKFKNICRLSPKLKFFVFSTNRGFKTYMECKKLQIGGELCFIC